VIPTDYAAFLFFAPGLAGQ